MEGKRLGFWQHGRVVLPCCFLLFSCLVLSFVVPTVCLAQEEGQEEGTTVFVEVVESTDPGPTPPPPPPKSDGSMAYTEIVGGSPGGEVEPNPQIIVDCWGMAKSQTTGRVDGMVNMQADCWLHFGKNPDTIDEIIMGPYKTDQALRVRYDLDGLTPNTKYYFKVEGHSLEHEGLIGWSPLRDFTTPGEGEGMIAGGPTTKAGPGGIPWWLWLPLGLLGLLLLWWWLLWKRLTDYVLAPVEGQVIFHEDGQPPDSPPVVRPRMRVSPKEPLFWMRDIEGNALMVYSEEYIRILKVRVENDYEVVEEHYKVLKVRRKWREALFTGKDDTKGHFYGWVWLEKQDSLDFE